MRAVYGCHDRPAFVPAYQATGSLEFIETFGKKLCQFTLTELGQTDSRCRHCHWRRWPNGDARIDALEFNEHRESEL